MHGWDWKDLYLLLLLSFPLEPGHVALSLPQTHPNLFSSKPGGRGKPMQEPGYLLRRCRKDEPLLDTIICFCGFVLNTQTQPPGMSLDMSNC